MRGLAVLLVMVVHFTRDRFFFGMLISLDTFFVMSGFLIVTLILDEWQRAGDVDLRAFYIRRGFRLLPALYMMLCLFVLAGVAGLWSFKRSLFEAAGAALYVYPLVLGIGGTDKSYLVPLWSLSVEEWFYFTLPWILVLVVLRRRSDRNAVILLGVLSVAMVLGVVAKMTIQSPDSPQRYIAQLRPELLGFGALVAFVRRWILLNRTPAIDSAIRWTARVGTLAYVCTIFWGTAFPDLRYEGDDPALIGKRISDTVTGLPAPRWFGQFFGALGGPGYTIGIVGVAAVILYTTTTTPNNWMARFLSVKLLVLAGTYSYALYLYHYPLANAVVPKLVPDSLEYDPHHVVASHLMLHFVLSAGLSVLAAYLSMRLVERPAQAFRRRRFASSTVQNRPAGGRTT